MLNAKSAIGWRMAGVVAALIAATAPAAESSAIPIASTIDYETTGRVGSVGVVGAPVVRFEGVEAGSLTTGGPSFDLGRLVVAPQAVDARTTYDNTPFDVTFTPRAVAGMATPEARPVQVRGWLYGTVTGSDTSHLQALMVEDSNLDVYPYPSYGPPFRVGPLWGYLGSAPSPAGDPPPSSGSLPIRSVLYATEAVPEPTTLALFGAVGAVAAIGRARGRGRGRRSRE